MRARARLAPLVVFALSFAGFVRTASAQSPEDKAVAETLFVEARTLIESGKFADACPKLAESQRRDPGLGTMLWLADCYENVGRTASAWAVFREAAAVAATHGDAREKVARERAASLEQKLSRLVIVAPRAKPGLVVERDGTRVDGAELGSPVPVDPGRHVVRAHATGSQPWETTVDVVVAGPTVTVEVPTLAPEVVATPPPIRESTPPPQDVAPASSSQRTIGLVVGAVGVVSLGVGAVAGIRAISLVGDADPHCPGKLCDSEGRQLVDDAKGAATVSTIGLVVGAVAVATGVVLFVTAPKASRSPSSAFAVFPYAANEGGGLGARGAW